MIPQELIESVITEMELLIRTLRLIADPGFWEQHERGMQQIRRGESITLAELLEKYGKS